MLATSSSVSLAGEPGPTFAWINGQVPTVEDVRQRPRPDYDPAGVRMGSFTIFPSIVTTLVYDDNVFARPKGDALKADELIYKVKPEFFARSSWSTHALAVYGVADLVGHREFDQYNHVNGAAGADGIIDVSRHFRIGTGVRYERQNESFGTGESFTRFDKPIAYDSYQGYLSGNVALRRLRLGVFGAARKYEYENTTDQGVLVDQTYRDHVTYEGAVRVGYEVGPTLVAFVQGGYDYRDHDTGLLTNSGWKLLGGVEASFSRLVSGEIYAGYFQRDFSTVGIRDIDGLTYGASLYWYVTPLVTIGLSATHDVNETALGGAGSYESDIVGVRADYELLRNVILTGRISYEHHDYNDTPRIDKVLRWGVSTAYLVSRNVAVSADYNRIDSESSSPTANYERDQLGVSIKMQY